MAAWLGLVPRECSTGGKQRLLGISKSTYFTAPCCAARVATALRVLCLSRSVDSASFSKWPIAGTGF